MKDNNILSFPFVFCVCVTLPLYVQERLLYIAYTCIIGISECVTIKTCPLYIHHTLE